MGHRRLFLLVLSIVFFLASTAQGGGHGQAATITHQQQGVGSMMRSMVGSRPPSCAGRCWWCGGRRCEAVQVPVTPQQELQYLLKKKGGHAHISRGSSSISSSAAAVDEQGRPSSYNDRSNYKPLSWRCMCGEVNLNP
ncbi:hypothetical protein PR202_gb24404 [Eleusine coracana subsp. coracana]|uniref:Epidermal patterning factor-like protein n=1 Tax=Eleusine coracana subsp. coracana TaxID=191504 RepID=A0AAV5FMG8_ELECO|nr:hypothetical protein QOZ80_5BG0448090 [Eleusine coracana subsp. coracana]GJN35610.1 hypothetical protein PR202_gb24404 [Eleusine coracana subsp. coracana]